MKVSIQTSRGLGAQSPPPPPRHNAHSSLERDSCQYSASSLLGMMTQKKPPLPPPPPPVASTMLADGFEKDSYASHASSLPRLQTHCSRDGCGKDVDAFRQVLFWA